MSSKAGYPDTPADGFALALTEQARLVRVTCSCGRHVKYCLHPGLSAFHKWRFTCNGCQQKIPASLVLKIYNTLMLERLVFLGDDAV